MFWAWRVLPGRGLARPSVLEVTPGRWPASSDLGDASFIVDPPREVTDNRDILPGAIHMKPRELQDGAREILFDRDIILYCLRPNEASSARAALSLKKLGITRIRPLQGGFEGWIDSGYPVVQKQKS